MTSTTEINTPKWWESYFKTEWEAHGGREQTRAFTLAALQGLAAEESYWLAQAGRSVCDWGCAMGDGVATLKARLPQATVCGLDGAQTALVAAREMYPEFAFASQWADLPSEDGKFDAVLCSNCLEHFDDPLEIALDHVAHVRSLYVVLVPYNENPLSPTHKKSWNEQTLPETLVGFTRLYSAVVPVDKAAWPAGEQLLLVYGSPSYVQDRQKLTATVKEKAKWDAIYADMPLVDVSSDDVVTAFNEELLEIMRPLLKPGCHVLEAGCGGGAQSLTLAQRGGYNVSLLDFSPQALDYAQRLFAQHGTPVKTIEADAFAQGNAEYDLVFNAGVLEHYTFDEQVRFLRGMASRSTRYVLVLVPNRACYWYWVWRLQKAASGQWPYGKEVPLMDMRAVFEAAGLQYMGQAFAGRRWSQSFVEGLEGLSDDLRALLLKAQRSGVLPSHSEGYLLAALGSVKHDDTLPESPLWSSHEISELRAQADQTAILADALANEVSAEASAQRAIHEVDLIRREAYQQTALLQKTIADMEVALKGAAEREAQARSNATLAVAEAFQRAAAAQEAALQAIRETQAAAATSIDAAYQLQQNATQEAQRRFYEDAQMQIQQTQQQMQSAQQQMHAAQQQAKAAEQQVAQMQLQILQSSISWRLTRPLRFAARLVRHGLLPQDKAKLRQLARGVLMRLPIPSGWKYGIQAKLSRAPKRQQAAFTDALQATPASNAPHTPNAIASNMSGHPDYFFWGVIDWHLRYQRPQQLAKGIADKGRRVFYVSSELRYAEVPGYSLEPLDAEGRLFQVHFSVSAPTPIYGALPSEVMLTELRLATGALLSALGQHPSIQVVQHPFWTDVATVVPNSRCVYDCMDHHAGFDNTAAAIIEAEKLLIARCDDIVVTSQWLESEIAPYDRPTHIIRNGCEFDHFAQRPAEVYADPKGRKVIGYYGAIAPWMDIELLRAVARSQPDALVLMIGADTTNAQNQLKDEKNIEWVGEVPYAKLPYYTHGFDVALLPFKIIPLTLATNPVKVYEYLSAGIEVVCIELPETLAFSEVARVATDVEGFVRAVDAALKAPQTPAQYTARQEFARENTWAKRVDAMFNLIETSPPAPTISVIVVTYNNLELTKACLASLENTSPLETLEIIVVDNASMDGTADFLRTWEKNGSNRKVLLNESNLGFAAANNLGLKHSTSQYLCLLNNDTFVTPGWASSLRKVLRNHSDIGIVGPVTNNIGNEARIDIAYANMAEMVAASARYTNQHLGQLLDIRAAAFFCVMFTRATLDKVGYLDEAYGLGFFEDDDYCKRVDACGLRVVCCEDVFVHHHLSASFDKMPSAARQQLMDKNKALYESKWGKWEPHVYRQ